MLIHLSNSILIISEERFWQEYVEPAESSMSASIMQGMDDPMVMPLEQVSERGIL